VFLPNERGLRSNITGRSDHRVMNFLVFTKCNPGSQTHQAMAGRHGNSRHLFYKCPSRTGEWIHPLKRDLQHPVREERGQQLPTPARSVRILIIASIFCKHEVDKMLMHEKALFSFQLLLD